MTSVSATPRGTFLSGLATRRLESYPRPGTRYLQLGLSVAATIVLYYELYVQGSVSTQILSSLHMSFNYLVGILVVGNFVGALASFAAGLADRWGRANIVCYGLFVTGAITAFGLPGVHGELAYGVLFALLSIVEGAVLVATPALIRDYSPQIGRASAMGFWTLGPVLGSLIVTEVATHTLLSHTDWQYQFHVAGTVGLIVAVIAFVGLRELAPKLRDQLMVTMRDRALVEARAQGLDTEKALQGHWRQMLTPGIMLPAAGISVFLLAYYVLVAFFVVFAATVLGYSEARANALANWYWIANAIALVVVGIASDKLKVRKPFMVGGAAISATALAIFATRTTHPTTSYYVFAALLAISAAGGGIAYCAWMAAFTESVEKRNPAATATGLAVWGMIIRITITIGFLILPTVVTASSPLVDKGPHVQALAAQYAPQLATLQKVDPATQAALAANAGDTSAQAKAVAEIAGGGTTSADVVKATVLGAQYSQQLATAAAIDSGTAVALFTNPADTAAQVKAVGEIAAKFGIGPTEATARLVALSQVPTADLLFLQQNGAKIQAAGAALTAAGSVPKADLGYLQANAATVQQAQKDAPGQWQTWFWVCFGGQIVFLLTVPLLTGRWSPRKANEDAAAHEALVTRELAALSAPGTEPGSVTLPDAGSTVDLTGSSAAVTGATRRA